jgi:RNA polymerase sigma-70 factor (ECF subfamily)
MTESPGHRQTPSLSSPLEIVFREQASYVWHTLRRMGVRAADLEDVTHEVFLVVHKLLPSFDPTRPLKPWLYGIAWRVAMRHKRRAVHRREVPGDGWEAAAPSEDSPDALTQANTRRDWVQRALAEVHESRRDVLVLHDLDGVSMPDIVAALGIPLNTGYSRLRLARKELQAALRALHDGETRP